MNPMRLRRAALSAACLLLAATGARAQWAIPLYTAQFYPSTGSWASYTMEDLDHGKVMARGTFRVAVVAREGRDFWLEAHFTRELPPPPPGQEKADLKLLVDPASPKTAKKTYMLTPMGLLDFAPLSAALNQAISSAPAQAPLDDRGLTTLTLGKKTLQVRELSDAHGWKTVYLKRGVGPYNVVEQVDRSGPRESRIILTSCGKRAKAELTGNPISFPSGPGMPDIGAMIQKAMQQAASQQNKGGQSPPPSGAAPRRASGI